MGKTEIVSARLHTDTKEKLIATGYNAAEAIEWFVYHFFSNNPEMKESIERDLLQIKLESLWDSEEDIKGQIEIIEEQLREGACG